MQETDERPSLEGDITKEQKVTFLTCVSPYRKNKIKNGILRMSSMTT